MKNCRSAFIAATSGQVSSLSAGPNQPSSRWLAMSRSMWRVARAFRSASSAVQASSTSPSRRHSVATAMSSGHSASSFGFTAAT